MTFPNGLIGDMSDVYSCRHNDLHVLRQSHMNDRIRGAQIGQVNQFCVYGDSAYHEMSHVTRKFTVNLNDRKIIMNRIMSSCRESIEHINCAYKSELSFITHKEKLKLRQGNVRNFLICQTVLINMYTCLVGNQVSLYFQLPPPSLEDFMI